MGMERLMMLERTCWLNGLSKRPLCATVGSAKGLSTSRHGSIQCPISGIVPISIYIMRQKDRRWYLDVAVKRGAECNTDHQFLCVRLRMARKVYHQRMPGTRMRRFDVSKLVRSEVHDHSGFSDTRDSSDTSVSTSNSSDTRDSSDTIVTVETLVTAVTL